MYLKIPTIFILFSAVSACVQDTPSYTPPKASGLIAGKPYPRPDDVCRIIGENSATSDFLDDSKLLIGCPTHEEGAIGDRQAEGGTIITRIGDWTLLHVPQR